MSLFLLLASLLPYLCAPATVWLFRLKRHGGEHELFDAVIQGALVWSMALWLQTNLLSLFNDISQSPIIIFWLLYSAILIFFLYKNKNSIRLFRPQGTLALIIFSICVLTFLAGLLYPPNLWDAMSYHLARVAHWLQNHTLAPYFTNIPRQIGMPPFNSMIALQSLAARGGDYFVFMGQWLAFIGNIIAVSHITWQLGGDKKAQLYAALFMATLPVAIMQASNTESSCIVTFWLLAFYSLTLSWLGSPSMRKAISLGLCLGLAILSKGSAYPLALPFVLVIAWHTFRSPKKLLIQSIIMAILVIGCNVPHLQRVWKAYGSVFGGVETNILARPGPATLTINALYNFLAHEPFLLQHGGSKIWSGIASALGVNENDRHIFPWGGIKRAYSEFTVSDGYGQSPIYALFLLILLLAVIARKFHPPALYSLATLFAFILYCLVLTWHPWTGRLHISLFALCAPLCGLYLDSWKSVRLRKGIIWLICLGALAVFLFGDHPINPIGNARSHFLLNSRDKLYIAEKRIDSEFVAAADFLAAHNPKTVGLLLADNSFEYPLWAILGERLQILPRIYHLDEHKKSNASMPEYIWVQENDENKGQIQAPYILKKEGNDYIKIFDPPKRKK